MSAPHPEDDAVGDGPVFEGVLDMPGHLLRRFQQIAVSMFLKECRNLDLTPLQFAAMAALRDCAPVDQATLGGMVALDRTTVGLVLGKLEARGLVARTVSSRDRRARLVRLTSAGEDLVDAARPAVERVQDQLLAPLAPEDRARLVTLMRTVVDAHNEESRAPLKS